MKPEEISKQKDILHQISQASDAIRREHKMLKLGKDTAEKAMEEMFKPIVTPLQTRGSYKWTDILDDLVNTYNNTKHSTIKMKPVDVTAAQEARLLENIYQPLQVKSKQKFKVGDKVRISKYKHVFDKGYTPNWTTEIFTIKSVQNTNPTTYKLVDYQDQPIEGVFYNEELSKVKYPDVYLVEKHNSWINKSDM
ncbi:uncharacterized protein LOC141534070 [Cotesia typhae]|uniref:uncharacterized protein LOC141534070 n=1 Tax=Cotesia typhae TaxID=2053667 RepID=UPI003D68B8A8